VATLGETVTFTCESSREKYWLYEGSELAPNVVVSGEKGKHLIIKGVTHLNSGFYKCVTITDNDKEEEAEVELIVVCKLCFKIQPIILLYTLCICVHCYS